MERASSSSSPKHVPCTTDCEYPESTLRVPCEYPSSTLFAAADVRSLACLRGLALKGSCTHSVLGGGASGSREGFEGETREITAITKLRVLSGTHLPLLLLHVLARRAEPAHLDRPLHHHVPGNKTTTQQQQPTVTERPPPPQSHQRRPSRHA